MSDIVEAVAKAIYAKQLEMSRMHCEPSANGWEPYEPLARAAIEAYGKATADQDERDRRVIWEAVERMEINPPDTPRWTRSEAVGFTNEPPNRSSRYSVSGIDGYRGVGVGSHSDFPINLPASLGSAPSTHQDTKPASTSEKL